MNSYQLVSESIIFDNRDLLYKFSEWTNDTINVLLITGIPGGGKSTLAKKLSEKHNCVIYSTDQLSIDWYNKIGFKKLEPHRTKMLYSGDSVEKINQIWIDDFINGYLIKLIEKQNKKCIFEGNHLVWLSLSFLENYAIILKGTSLFKSVNRKRKRLPSKLDEDLSKIINIMSIKWISRFNQLYKYLKQK